MKKIIECVPNFSEGRDTSILKQIAQVIRQVDGVQLLDIDPGKSTNRTVVTFVGEPESVIEAAYQAIVLAADLIDMSQHSGEHPRMGATDVCPFIPISGVTLAEAAEYSRQLARRVGKAGIPVYMYEAAASEEKRRNLADIRRGEYEGLAKKMQDPEWKPDYGPDEFNPRAGATVIGARDFLVAYNVNLNTRSVRRANSVAFDIRERGRVKREGNKITGAILRDEQGQPLREPGMLKHVKAIGWYIDEYKLAQISMNLTNINETPLHMAFEACCKSADQNGLRVTGSELVGLLPKRVLIEAGEYFLRKQRRSVGVSEAEIIDVAVRSLGLGELKEFDPKKKIIEYLIAGDDAQALVDQTLQEFAHETASDSPAPGGGSISAAVGAMGAALGTMVANLSANKRQWDDRVEEFSAFAQRGQQHIQRFLTLVDEDTLAFDGIMNAMRLPKSTPKEKEARLLALEKATLHAIDVPLMVMREALHTLDLLEDMAHQGNPNSISDAGVGALCVATAAEGAYMNVLINLGEYADLPEGQKRKEGADQLLSSVKNKSQQIVDHVYGAL